MGNIIEFLSEVRDMRFVDLGFGVMFRIIFVFLVVLFVV